MADSVHDFGPKLQSSSVFLPSPECPTNMSSATRSVSTMSNGSRSLKAGDWRLVAAAETGGGPVQPLSDGFTFAVTPNIDDVHSPASSVAGVPSPGFGSRSPMAFSPLRPKVLPTTSAYTDGIRKSEQQPKEESEASFSLRDDLWPSPSRFQGRRSCVGSPALSSPYAAPTLAGSDGELSTPGSGGYSSPEVRPSALQTSAVRSSVAYNTQLTTTTNNPLFVDRPTPSGSDPVAKTLVLSPAEDNSIAKRPDRRSHDWSSSPSEATLGSPGLCEDDNDDVCSGGHPVAALHEFVGASSCAAKQTRPCTSSAAIQKGGALTCPRSPDLPALDLETPRRSIKSLSMALNSAAQGAVTACDMAVSAGTYGNGVPLAVSGSGTQGTPCTAPGHCTRYDIKAAAESQQLEASSTPCSAAISGAVRKPPLAAMQTSSPRQAACSAQPPPAHGPVALRTSVTGTAALVEQASNGQTQAMLDASASRDVSGGGASDQSPRRAVRPGIGGPGATMKGMIEKSPVKSGPPADQGKSAVDVVSAAQPSPVPQLTPTQGPQQQSTASQNSSGFPGKALRTATSWLLTLLVLAAAAITFNSFSLQEAGPFMISVQPIARNPLAKLGPVCFPDKHPVALSLSTQPHVQTPLPEDFGVPTTAAPEPEPEPLGIVVSDMSTSSLQLPFSWSAPAVGPNCHWMDGLVAAAATGVKVTGFHQMAALEGSSEAPADGGALDAAITLDEPNTAHVSDTHASSVRHANLLQNVDAIADSATTDDISSHPATGAHDSLPELPHDVINDSTLAPEGEGAVRLAEVNPAAVLFDPLIMSSLQLSGASLGMDDSAPPAPDAQELKQHASAALEDFDEDNVLGGSSIGQSGYTEQQGTAAHAVPSADVTYAQPRVESSVGAPEAARHHVGGVSKLLIIGAVVAAAFGAMATIITTQGRRAPVSAAAAMASQDAAAASADSASTPLRATTAVLETPMSGRILRLKASPFAGGKALPTDERTHTAVSTSKEGIYDGSGHYIWKNNKLVYVETDQ